MPRASDQHRAASINRSVSMPANDVTESCSTRRWLRLFASDSQQTNSNISRLQDFIHWHSCCCFRVIISPTAGSVLHASKRQSHAAQRSAALEPDACTQGAFWQQQPASQPAAGSGLASTGPVGGWTVPWTPTHPPPSLKQTWQCSGTSFNFSPFCHASFLPLTHSPALTFAFADCATHSLPRCGRRRCSHPPAAFSSALACDCCSCAATAAHHERCDACSHLGRVDAIHGPDRRQPARARPHLCVVKAQAQAAARGIMVALRCKR